MGEIVPAHQAVAHGRDQLRHPGAGPSADRQVGPRSRLEVRPARDPEIRRTGNPAVGRTLRLRPVVLGVAEGDDQVGPRHEPAGQGDRLSLGRLSRGPQPRRVVPPDDESAKVDQT